MVKIADEVYETVTVTLQDEDETKVVLRPLPIKRLKKFFALLRKLSKEAEEKVAADEAKLKAGEVPEAVDEDEDAEIDFVLALVAVCLEKNHKALVEDREKLEDALDMPTGYKIIEVCGGVKLNDPKLLALAMEKAQKEDGTN